MKLGKKILRILSSILLHLGILKHSNRRHGYFIGWLASGKTLEDLRVYLHSQWGFGDHFVTWVDRGQVLNWRKLDGRGGQYHLRVYQDGEMRGHFEMTPEAHPLGHIFKENQTDAREKFLEFLGDFVVKRKYISNLVVDPNAVNPAPEN